MSETRLTPQAERDIEEGFTLKHRAVELLDLVVAEWRSDPTSVQCFDLRIVEEAKEVTARLARLRRKGAWL